MKVTAFNGSPRPDGNTSILIDHVFEVLENRGIDCEKVQIGGKPVQGCTACMECWENQNMKCVIDDDVINDCIRKMKESEGLKQKPSSTGPDSSPQPTTTS